jgi:L-threonylcarbamoyladenylate synthase
MHSPSIVTSQIAQAVQLLQAGELIGLPTETVYGLGADASQAKAVEKIFAAKGRPSNHPLIVHIAHLGQLEQWARNVPHYAYALAQAFWPGPLTLILPRAAHVLDAVTGGQDTVGIRIPSHPLALQVLTLFGGGVAAPSANKFGRISPTTAQHVAADFGAELFVLEGGACEVGIESTIVDCTQDAPRILRPGHITSAQIAASAQLGLNANMAEAPRVSGALAAHYAPRTPMRVLGLNDLKIYAAELSSQAKHFAVLATQAIPGAAYVAAAATNRDDYEAQLYAHLRDLDARGSELILVQDVPTSAEWSGVRDRLSRAAVGSGS